MITEDKTGLHPFRLLSILALTWLVARTVPRGAAWLESRLAAPLVLMGQNSLPVFCFGIFFGFIARLGLEYDDGWGMQGVVNLLRCGVHGGGRSLERVVSRQGPDACRAAGCLAGRGAH